MTSPSPEQLAELQARQEQANRDNQTRQALLQGFGKIFGELVQFLNNIQLNPTYRTHCYQNLDQASFWAKEAISMAQFGAPEAPKLEVVANEVKEGDLILNNKTDAV